MRMVKLRSGVRIIEERAPLTARSRRHEDRWISTPKWGTVTQISADRFLVKHGFLKGESPLKTPESGEQLISETEK